MTRQLASGPRPKDDGCPHSSGRHGPKEALTFDGTSYTYAQVDVEAERVARMRAAAIERGESDGEGVSRGGAAVALAATG